ncbi:MAG: HD domain-containing protein [Firmicutes bacterium]|nr:HD domain-containing protein [Bacillota bacterium]
MQTRGLDTTSNIHSTSIRSDKADQTPYADLEKAVLANNPSADRKLLRDAFNYAKEVHSHQTRDEGTPYFNHPYRVAMYMANEMHVGDANAIATGLLHDVMEDGKGVTRSVLEEKFNDDVARNVSLLSKKKVPDSQHEQMLTTYYEGIKKAPLDVKRVKISDRLDNIRSLHLSPDKEKVPRYIKETREIYLPMAKECFAGAAKEIENILKNLEAK